MPHQQNPMVNELLVLIEDGKTVVEIRFDKQLIPPKYVNFQLGDGSIHKFVIDMKRDEFLESLHVLKAWWSMIHKIKIQDIAT